MKVLLFGGYFDNTEVDIKHPIEILRMALPAKPCTLSVENASAPAEDVYMDIIEYRRTKCRGGIYIYKII